MGKKFRVWCFSDTHGKEKLLNIPENIDMAIFAGDSGTFKAPAANVNSILNFLEWYKNVNIPHKIFIAGNHCTSIEAGLVTRADIHESITYLEHETKEVAGFKIFGSPYTPEFHQWAFNVPRHKIDEYWKEIPQDTDILVTHGPAKGILDLTLSHDTVYGGYYEMCGCKSLLNHVKRVAPKLHVFGHIHNESDCNNAGIYQMHGLRTKFINASVLDLRYEKHNDGIVIEI